MSRYTIGLQNEVKYENHKSNGVWKGAVTLSFDDGWRSVYDNALPILENAGIKATYYIISGHLDGTLFPAYVNTEQILHLYKQGHEIGCHTSRHLHLTQKPDSIVESEIVLSLNFLRRLGIMVDSFAYPFGEYDDRVLKVVKGAGLLGARSVMQGLNDSATNRFLLNCEAVKVSTRVSEVIDWIQSARTLDKWLILMFHQIDEEGRAWSARPEMLAEVVKYLRENDVHTMTVREGLKALQNVEFGGH